MSKFVTDRQTNCLTPYTGVCGFFHQVKFATSLLALLAGGWKIYLFYVDRATYKLIRILYHEDTEHLFSHIKGSSQLRINQFLTLYKVFISLTLIGKMGNSLFQRWLMLIVKGKNYSLFVKKLNILYFLQIKCWWKHVKKCSVYNNSIYLIKIIPSYSLTCQFDHGMLRHALATGSYKLQDSFKWNLKCLSSLLQAT